MNKCLIIIDPQKDFISVNGFYALKHKNISRILEAKRNINELLNKINKNIPVIIVYSDYFNNQFGENISMCIPETEGHEIDININESYIYCSKNEHSAFSSNELKNYLNINHIKTIYLAGFLAEYCVRKTAIDAIKSNYEIILLKDCIATGDDFQKKLLSLFEEVINLGGNVAGFTECL